MTTLFIDVDTQFDFMYPAGALYVPGAERIIPTIYQLNRHAAAHSILVISDTDAHACSTGHNRSSWKSKPSTRSLTLT